MRTCKKTCVKHLNCKLYYRQLHLKYWCNLARYWLQAPWGWHDNVETCRRVIICEIIVHLLVIVQNSQLVVSHIKEARNPADISNTVDVSKCFLVKARPSKYCQPRCAEHNTTRDISGHQSTFTADSVITETGVCGLLLCIHSDWQHCKFINQIKTEFSLNYI